MRRVQLQQFIDLSQSKEIGFRQSPSISRQSNPNRKGQSTGPEGQTQMQTKAREPNWIAARFFQWRPA